MASSADAVMAKVKACSAPVALRDWERVQTALTAAAASLQDRSVFHAKGTGVEAALRALLLLSGRPADDAACGGAEWAGTLAELVGRLLSSAKCSQRVAVLGAACVSAWGTPLPAAARDFDYTRHDNPHALEAFATLLGSTGSVADMTEQALPAALWVTPAGSDKGKRFASVQRLAWPLLLQLLDVSAKPPPSVATVLVKVRGAVEALLLTTEAKRGSLEPDGAKMAGGDPWSILNSPSSVSVGYTDLQEVHAWAFAAVPALLADGLVSVAHQYAMRVLVQLGRYMTRGVYALNPGLGHGVGLSFVEGVVVQLLPLLSRLVRDHPACGAEAEGEAMGLFFQILAQTRRSPALPPPRAHTPVASWTGEDAHTRSAVACAGASPLRGEAGPPPAWLAAHVPHDLLLESVTGDVAVADDAAGGVPVWKGELLLCFLEFFAETEAAAESAVVDAFFTSPHWASYAQSHAFAPSLFRYLARHGQRPAFEGVRDSVHLRVLRVTALSPHSCASQLLRSLPSLITRTTYLDVLYRLLDLPLLSYLLSRPGLAPDGSNAAQVLGGILNQGAFGAAVARALLSSAPFQGCEDSEYCTFWAEHKGSTDRWVADVEPWTLTKKALASAAHVPRLLQTYFACVSLEAERDPVVAVNVVTALIARYHSLHLPLQCARTVRALLIHEIYTFVSKAPQVLQLVMDELVACVCQYHIGKRSHRCVRLTGAAASVLSQSLLNVVRPPSDPTAPAGRVVQLVFSELQKALFDVLSMLHRRFTGVAEEMYDADASLYRLADQGSRRNPNRNLHDAIEASYTVWDAVECVDALSVALCTLAIQAPPYVEAAKECCYAVARAADQGVLPGSMLQSAALLLSWLEHPAAAQTAVIRRCPPVGALPVCVDSQTPVSRLRPGPASALLP